MHTNWTTCPSRIFACALFFLAGALALDRPAVAQERASTLPRTSPNAVISQTVGVSDVTLRYGRPGVREREVFGDLVPYGEVWRTGANEANAITFSDDVMVQGQPLEAGTYALFTIPGEGEWTVIFNNSQQWGAFNYDEAQDALRVTVTPEEAHPHELLSFHFTDVTDTTATLALHWAETAVPLMLAFDTGAIVQEQANAAVPEATDWRVPAQYAAYALESGAPLTDALTWADRAVELEENYNTLALKARLLAETGDYAEAAEWGDRAVGMGQAMDEAPRGLDEMETQVASWKEEAQ